MSKLKRVKHINRLAKSKLCVKLTTSKASITFKQSAFIFKPAKCICEWVVFTNQHGLSISHLIDLEFWPFIAGSTKRQRALKRTYISNIEYIFIEYLIDNWNKTKQRKCIIKPIYTSISNLHVKQKYNARPPSCN